MIKYFCDICGKQVDGDFSLEPVKIWALPDGANMFNFSYQACYQCRDKLNKYILEIQDKAKKEEK